AYFVDCSVSNSVLKKPGLTIVVLIPNGETSVCNACINPSNPNLDAEYALQNSKLVRPAVEEIDMICPERCLRIIGRTERVTIIGPIKLVCSCCPISSCVNSSKKPAI